MGVELDRVQHPHERSLFGDSEKESEQDILGPVEQARWETNGLSEAQPLVCVSRDGVIVPLAKEGAMVRKF
jgi:hypothetical protein